jgi:hypothetical protein
MIDLQHSSREIESLTGRLAADLRRRIQQPAPPELNQGLAHAPGARVLDLVTGQEGVIIGGSTDTVIIPTA